jgi:hypothetical protein
MRRKLLLTSIGVGLGSALFAAGALAAPGHLIPHPSADLLTLAHHGGMGMGGGHMSMHSVGPHMAGPNFFRSAHVFPHEHFHHHHRRFFIAGVPYYDYYYD